MASMRQQHFEFYGKVLAGGVELCLACDIRYAAAQARLLETQVADTASYFGVRPLVAALSKGDAELRVDTIFEKLVPTSTVETAWADQYPVGAGAWIEAAPRQVMATTREAWAGNIYLHTSVLPGSVELAGYTDNGMGALVSDRATVACWIDAEGRLNDVFTDARGSAHGEGFANFSARGDLGEVHQVARFVDHHGAPATTHPFNPNGSPGGLTAVTVEEFIGTIPMPL